MRRRWFLEHPSPHKKEMKKLASVLTVTSASDCCGTGHQSVQRRETGCLRFLRLIRLVSVCKGCLRSELNLLTQRVVYNSIRPSCLYLIISSPNHATILSLKSATAIEFQYQLATIVKAVRLICVYFLIALSE